jgi:hypothetical protein
MSRLGIELGPPVGGEHSSKELFEQAVICYLEHLYMSLPQEHRKAR